MQVTGRVKRVCAEVVVTETFRKRELHVETAEQYPQIICVEFTNDKCSALDGLAVGSEVEVSINLRGREWTNPKDGEIRVFNTIQGWKVTPKGEAAPAQSHSMPTYTPPPAADGDGLPF
jgi:hypothetical protein